MLRLTRITDYGIVLMTRLAADPERQPRNARALAVDASLPLPVVSKVLKALARDGLLCSQRGARGGYRLARSPERISVAAIICALEGPIAITECSAGGCEHETSCAVRDNWQKINDAIRVALESLTLRDMAEPKGLDLVRLSRRPLADTCQEQSRASTEIL